MTEILKMIKRKMFGFKKDFIHLYREHPRCPACAMVYNDPYSANIRRHGRSSFFGVCSAVRIEHLHFYCRRCGKSWITACAPPLPTPTEVKKPKEPKEPKKDSYCRTCDNAGIIEHKEKMYKCPDCPRGDIEKDFWEDGIPTLVPAPAPEPEPTPDSISKPEVMEPIVAEVDK